MSNSIESTLRAMASNYAGGHSWDHLDGEAVSQAADEIERLTRRCANAELALKYQTQNCDNLRAQLAEAHALLREALGSVHVDAGKCESSSQFRELVALGERIDAALSASAEPSAPVEIDERAEFEKDFSTKGRPLTRADYDPNAYGNAFDDGAWCGWQARAALGRKP